MRIVIAAAGLLLAACGTGSTAQLHPGLTTSEVRIALGIDPDTLDPKRQTTTTIANVVQMVVESLTKLDRTGDIGPGLATEWQEASDGMTWTFTLRGGVRFSDGAPFDARAAKDSLDRALEPSSVCPLCGALPSAIRSVDVLDPAHLRLSMSVPLAAEIVVGLLSTTSYGILSPRVIQAGTLGHVQQERPVGTGPYVLQERRKGERVVLRRNDGYWGRPPTYARQVFQIVPDAATREALVRSGQVQVVLLPPISDLPSLQRDPTVRVLMAPSDRVVFFAIDTVDRRQPMLQNPRVRQALNFAINRDAIVRSTLFGAGEPAVSPLAPSIFGYCMVSNPYRYDPALARSMLQQANASDLSISLIAPTGRYIQDFQAAQNVVGQLRAIGVTVQGPRTMDWPDYVRTIMVPPDRASVDVHMLGWAPPILDASQAMVPFDPGQIPPNGLETSYYDNPAVTALLARAQVERHRDARAQQYCDAQKLIWDDAPLIFLWIQKFPIVHSSQVTGIGFVPNESFDTVYARPAWAAPAAGDRPGIRYGPMAR